MADLRECQLMIATGCKGVGKTWRTCREIRDYITPNPSIGKRPRRVLIFDTNKEYTNDEMQKNEHGFETRELELGRLEEWVNQNTIEVRRILPVDANGRNVGIDKYKDILKVILHYFRGGMILLEDINKYLPESSSKEILGTITTIRHVDTDVYIHLQSLSRVTTGMWQNANVFRTHFQTDEIDRDRVNNYEMFKINEILLRSVYFTKHLYPENERYFSYVQNLENRITGNYTTVQFIEACREYLIQNPNIVGRRSLKYGGKKNENMQMATKEYIVELYKKYYDGVD